MATPPPEFHPADPWELDAIAARMISASSSSAAFALANCLIRWAKLKASWSPRDPGCPPEPGPSVSRQDLTCKNFVRNSANAPASAGELPLPLESLMALAPGPTLPSRPADPDPE